MSAPVSEVLIAWDAEYYSGRMTFDGDASSAIRDRIQQSIILAGNQSTIRTSTIEAPWPVILRLIREFGSQQRLLNFRFRPDGTEAREKIAAFVSQYKELQSQRDGLALSISLDEVQERLVRSGFTERQLTGFQLRDLQRLLSLSNGANFSVPGAGKTSVTLALHLLVRGSGTKLLVVAPKSAMMAWSEAVHECISPNAPNSNCEQFLVLSGNTEAVRRALVSGYGRFIINYDAMLQVPEALSAFLAEQPVHLVLDEAHRIKAGYGSQRGSFLLNVAPLAIRRDILTGTPMPQHQGDIVSQLDFLWPGSGLGLQIEDGSSPRAVLGDLYVRTTKEELGLPKPHRQFRTVAMDQGQLALYAIVRNEALREFSSLKRDKNIDLLGAKKSVMRLLQLSANPLLALRGIAQDTALLDSGIVESVIEEGPSSKMRDVASLARELAQARRKAVIWTIFTDTILQMEALLADLNPVTLYGQVPSGSLDDPRTREGRLRRFHNDPNCMVLIANPAAAGEGISLHKVCHDAIYLDRSYVSTHYLQSVDRIHRLGLPLGVETNIYIFQTTTPAGLGSIDHSVSRRLAKKLRAMQVLLDDPDLHQIALDEENADEPIDFDLDVDDIVDLIEELEGRSRLPDEDAE